MLVIPTETTEEVLLGTTRKKEEFELLHVALLTNALAKNNNVSSIYSIKLLT